MTQKDAICTVLRAIRIHHKITQETIRNDIHLDVSKYESGHFYPGLENFISLCEYFRVDPGDVLAWSKLLKNGKIKAHQISLLLTA